MRRNILLSFVLALGALIALATAMYTNLTDPSRATARTSTLYECDGDGRLCPDGSVVGRTGPSCEFSACPGVMPAAGDAVPAGISVLSGRVILSCYVNTLVPDPMCVPKAHPAHVIATSIVTGKQVAEGRTTSNGAYIFDLPPGTYRIHAESETATCEDIEIILEEGERRTLNVPCHTGLK